MSTTSFFTLFESASGWALFSILEAEEIGALLADVSNPFSSSSLSLHQPFLQIKRYKMEFKILLNSKEL